MPAKVLIPLDAYRNSKAAEEYAVKLHKNMPLKAVLLHVIDTKELDGHGLDPGLKESILAAKRKTGEKIVAQAAEVFKAAGIEFERIIITGDPSHLICYTAKTEDVDMVLMAESGRSEFQDWFVGSVTNYVLYRCTTPVLLVKHPRS